MRALIVLCVDCFSNYGLRIEAARIAVADGTACPNCGGSGDRITTTGQIDDLLQRFFAHGSTSATGTLEPIFKLRGAKLEPENVAMFDRTLRADYSLLVQHSACEVFRNAPSTWRMGYTEVADDLATAIAAAADPQRDNAVINLLDRIIDHCPVTTIQTGRAIYRVRRDLDQPFDHSQFDSPPTSLSKPTRFSDGTRPVLYGAFDVETCLHECRVLAEHRLTLATLLTTRALRVVDLSDVPYDVPGASAGGGGDLFYFINAQLLFGQRTQASHLFASRIRERGFDGIVYPSFLSHVRSHRGPHLNIALFGMPLRDHVIELESLNRVRLEAIKYDFAFGPVTQLPSRVDLEDFLKLSSELSELQGEFDPREVASRLRELAGRVNPKD